MNQLIVATHNRNKFKEMAESLSGAGWEILPGYDFLGMPQVEEDGTTLEDNSLKKARVVSEFTRLPALSDDTGLFVDALDGRPGIYAARFAGENCTYEDNVRKLLGLMAGVPQGKRSAFFRTVITLYYPDGQFWQVAGEVRGNIATEARGQEGFGYDPVFRPSGSSKVFAEMTLEEKNKISHRGLAVQKARELLKVI